MSIWPMEGDCPNPGEVFVTRDQFYELMKLAESHQEHQIETSEYVSRAKVICPHLVVGRENRLFVQDERPKRRILW